MEAGNINKSLLYLGNVIEALAFKKEHIPYRNSHLTRILQNCFGGNSYLNIILCASTHQFHHQETLSTLRFGDRANKLKNKPIVNKEPNFDELRARIAECTNRIVKQCKNIHELQDDVSD